MIQTAAGMPSLEAECRLRVPHVAIHVQRIELDTAMVGLFSKARPGGRAFLFYQICAILDRAAIFFSWRVMICFPARLRRNRRRLPRLRRILFGASRWRRGC